LNSEAKTCPSDNGAADIPPVVDRLPTIFFSSRTRHAGRWKAMREAWSDKFKAVSSWIDEAGPGMTADLAELAVRCLREAASADTTVVYAEPGDLPLKGALMEVGAALAAGKRVHWCGPCQESALMRHPGIRTFESIHEAVAAAISVIPGPDPADQAAELAKLRSYIEFLREKGLTVGPMKSSDREEPYLAYVIRLGSDFDDSRALTEAFEAKQEVRKIQAELDAVKARVGDVYLREPAEPVSDRPETGDSLLDRLHGIYTIPVNDGAGPLNGKNAFTRRFPLLPINLIAADEIERLRGDRDRMRTAGRKLMRILDDELDYRPDDEAGGEYADACEPFR